MGMTGLCGCSSLTDLWKGKPSGATKLLHCWDTENSADRWTLDVTDINPQGLAARKDIIVAGGLEKTTGLSGSTGAQLWQIPLEIDLEENRSTLFSDHSLYCRSGDEIIKLDLNSGQKLWSARLDELPVALRGGTLFCGGIKIRALNSTTGKPRWPRALERDRLVAVTREAFFTANQEILEARRPQDGQAIWKARLPEDFTPFEGLEHSGGLLLLARNGSWCRLDLKSRRFTWIQPGVEKSTSICHQIFGDKLIDVIQTKKSTRAVEIDCLTGSIGRQRDLDKPIKKHSLSVLVKGESLLFCEQAEQPQFLYLQIWKGEVLARIQGAAFPHAFSNGCFYFTEHKV